MNSFPSDWTNLSHVWTRLWVARVRCESWSKRANDDQLWLEQDPFTRPTICTALHSSMKNIRKLKFFIPHTAHRCSGIKNDLWSELTVKSRTRIPCSQSWRVIWNQRIAWERVHTNIQTKSEVTDNQFTRNRMLRTSNNYERHLENPYRSS